MSTLKVQTKRIRDIDYEVAPLPFDLSLDVLWRLKGIVAPALRVVSQGRAGDKEGSPDLVIETLLRSAILAGASLLENAKRDDLTYLLQTFAKRTTVHLPDDKAPLLSSRPNHFEGELLPDLFVWLWFCVEVNFGSFFAEVAGTTRDWRALLLAAVQELRSNSASPQGATGGSGGSSTIPEVG